MGMEFLLRKYAGGRIPPLMAPEDEPDVSGLLDRELVAIYQRGFSGTYSTPLGILVAGEVQSPVAGKWEDADFRLNDYAMKDWTLFCRRVRGIPAGNQTCDQCDRLSAVRAEQQGSVIAYICCHGVIDFAVPVFVEGTVIAAMLTGQRKPKPHMSWNPKMTGEGGLYRPLPEGEDGVDIWPHCTKIIHQVETEYGFTQGELLSLLDEDVERYPGIEVSPADVEHIMAQLTKAGEHLSNLATTTFHLEKSKIVAWIRSEIARSLKSLTEEPPNFEKFWRSTSDALALASRYFGCDYAAVLSCQDEPEPSLSVLAHSGDQVERASTQWVFLPEEQVRRLMEVARDDEVQHVDASLYAPAVEQILSEGLSAEIGIACGVSIPIKSSKASAYLIVTGRAAEDFSLCRLSEIDSQALDEILGDISQVVRVALLIDELEAAAKRQASFVLDVAHNIRNPIQNIVLKAERLRSGWVQVQDIPYQAKRLATQVKRLHLLSERVWTLEAFERGTFKVERGVRLNVYDVIRECRDSLLDMASTRQIEISVDRELQRWPPLDLDRRFFTQTILNLLDNAAKYSSRETEVRVDGKEDGYGWHISVVNRGLPIEPDETGQIFTRFYRTAAARQYVMEGTGIGLFLVKKFADIYGAVSVKSQPIGGTDDYVTEFILSIERE